MESFEAGAPTELDAVIVGGGLAGLTAAATIASGARSALVVEKGRAIGGCAATTSQEGYLFNLGPHALFNKGAGRAVLSTLGIAPTGRTPGVDGAYALRDADLVPFPGTPWRLLTTSLLSTRERFEAVRVLSTLGRQNVADIAHLDFAEWLRTTIRGASVRQLVAALGRVSTYAADLDRLSAGVALSQIRSALDGGVLYADGGWQSIVDRLAAVAVVKGARIATSRRVDGIELVGDKHRVRFAGGDAVDAAAIVLATSPSEASALLPSAAPLHSFARSAMHVRAACLDVALEALPRPRATFALGLDRDVYFSVHSAYAELAPVGGAVIHVMKYLSADDTSDRSPVERELESIVDRMQPGWRRSIVARRFLPHLTVSNALPTSEGGGYAGRPGVCVDGARGIFLAGDWVGATGLLADASLASGREAGQRALAEIDAVRARGPNTASEPAESEVCV